MDLLERVLLLTDHTRLAEEASQQPEWYKEWFHFCLIGPEIEAIVNFSFVNDNRPAAEPRSRLARLILLVHGDGWEGDLVEIPAQEVEINPGRIDLRFGQNRLRYENGGFHISAALETRPLTLDVQIQPITYPLLRNRAPIGVGKIDWLVVPRLKASGTLVAGRRVYRLENMPVYHDHNWGHWLWGQDFAWVWGFALPTRGAAGWSLVYDRMTNRARSQVQELKLCLWKDEKLVKIFAHGDIQAHPQGYLSSQRIPKFPRIMGLIAPEITTDVPRTLEIEARSGSGPLGSSMLDSDWLLWRFEAGSIAQIVVPNETDLLETVINEVTGSVQVEGSVKGETFQFEGKGFFEFLT